MLASYHFRIILKINVSNNDDVKLNPQGNKEVSVLGIRKNFLEHFHFFYYNAGPCFYSFY